MTSKWTYPPKGYSCCITVTVYSVHEYLHLRTTKFVFGNFIVNICELYHLLAIENSLHMTISGLDQAHKPTR